MHMQCHGFGVGGTVGSICLFGLRWPELGPWSSLIWDGGTGVVWFGFVSTSWIMWLVWFEVGGKLHGSILYNSIYIVCYLVNMQSIGIYIHNTAPTALSDTYSRLDILQINFFIAVLLLCIIHIDLITFSLQCRLL